MTDEVIDILNDEGIIIGSALRSELMQAGFRNFRLVSAFIRSSDGMFHMFRRAYQKKAFGGCFASVGGCVQAGESYDDALFREIEEEIGLKQSDYAWQLLGYTSPTIDDTYGHVAVYELIVSRAILYNEDDFCEVRVMSLDQLRILCDENLEVSHNLPIYTRKFYLIN